MNITFLTFYYPPDLSAGSFRAAALVEALSAQLRAEDRVTIITTSPNRYKEASVEAPETETHGPVTIRRVRLPQHDSGMVDQAKAFAHFARHALKIARASRPDLVIGTSSRLFTASLAAVVATRYRAKLYLDIRDIFSDTIGDVFGSGLGRLVMPVISALERSTIRRADVVNLVSPGFLGIFQAMAPGKQFRTFTNGIDPEWLTPLPPSERPFKRPVNIVFAGNIGEGQGLHKNPAVSGQETRDRGTLHHCRCRWAAAAAGNGVTRCWGGKCRAARSGAAIAIGGLLCGGRPAVSPPQ